MKNKKRFFLIILVIGLSAGLVYWFTRGSNTIEYTDQNNNGVWDDVEPFIEATAKNENQRKALEFEFISYQKRLLNPKIGLESKNSKKPIPTDIARSSECINKVWGGYGKLDYRLVRSAILTSWSRHRAWAKYNANLSGGIYSLWDEEKHGNPCPFELVE